MADLGDVPYAVKSEDDWLKIPAVKGAVGYMVYTLVNEEWVPRCYVPKGSPMIKGDDEERNN